MGRPCHCCCAVAPLCTAAIGHRTPVDLNDETLGFDELFWKLTEATSFTTENIQIGCTLSNESVGASSGDPAIVPIGFDVAVTDPNDIWCGLKIFWPSDCPPFNQLAWLHEITDRACYARPNVGLQYRFADGGDFDSLGLTRDFYSQSAERSPLVYVGFVVRDNSDPQNPVTWFTRFADASGELNAGSFAGVGLNLLPRCWGTLWQEAFNDQNNAIQWFRIDSTRNLPDNVGDMWPLQNLPPTLDAQTLLWSDGDDPPPPFLNFPPTTHDLQIGLYIAIANKPDQWTDYAGTTHTRGPNWIHDARANWALRMDLRSACVTAKVRPHCQAWFAELDTLDLSVPDAFPPKQGRWPCEPTQWRGMAFTLTRQQIDLTGVGDNHYRPEWTIARPYWRTAYYGSFADPSFTNGATLHVCYVPCVALWLYIVPATGCPFMIKINHDPQGANVSPDNDSIFEDQGGVVVGTFLGEPWETETTPWFYAGSSGWGGGLGEDQLFEPALNPLSYDPVALAYRVAVANYYFGQIGFETPPQSCNTEPCDPATTHWSCNRTLLAMQGYTANYVMTEVAAGVLRADQFWLWLELRAPSP